MKLEDAFFNWLQMKIVEEARPDDRAAKDTRMFFEEILREDHAIAWFETSEDETRIHIDYEAQGTSKKLFFDKEHAEQLLHDINSNPKYNQ
ncbi:hypothetical protein N0M98_25355 [Paenibacillus doosanensis]|uniref:Uncharacterized protein n=1 Tax=Paenibacillus konkukensis TaxID=2020716 RepID=A0ABY4RZI5_9BACL|nr:MULTISPECIES: hypothetical protein [Paenibacillus]MCS7463438.1 hypothetical protein [Paenibacillus doosanensis]UQZ87026.1 hypothetical protein SK3146_06319 [Paenibacillus konkukensis]